MDSKPTGLLQCIARTEMLEKGGLSKEHLLCLNKLIREAFDAGFLMGENRKAKTRAEG